MPSPWSTSWKKAGTSGKDSRRPIKGRDAAYCISTHARRLVDVDVYVRTTHNDAAHIVTIVVIIVVLISIGLAAVLLSLPGRKTTVAPSGLLAFAPSRRCT